MSVKLKVFSILLGNIRIDFVNSLAKLKVNSRGEK